MVKASATRAEDPEFESRLRHDFFGSRVIPVTSKSALQWLPCQAPGVLGSVLGLVGAASVCCDWVRWKVWSATSISVWQHVQLSEQIRPWETLACCWDVKQPTKKHWKTQFETHSYYAANFIQHIERLSRCKMCATWYEGTAQLLSLTRVEISFTLSLFYWPER